jgi:hypothetical protein
MAGGQLSTGLHQLTGNLLNLDLSMHKQGHEVYPLELVYVIELK